MKYSWIWGISTFIEILAILPLEKKSEKDSGNKINGEDILTWFIFTVQWVIGFRTFWALRPDTIEFLD